MAKRKIIKPEKRAWWQEFHEDIHQKAKPVTGGKDMKMSNKSTTQDAKASTPKQTKSSSEHFKDIAIAILITGVIAFIGGMHFANQRNAEMQQAVSAATLSVKK